MAPQPILPGVGFKKCLFDGVRVSRKFRGDNIRELFRRSGQLVCNYEDVQKCCAISIIFVKRRSVVVGSVIDRCRFISELDVSNLENVPSSGYKRTIILLFRRPFVVLKIIQKAVYVSVSRPCGNDAAPRTIKIEDEINGHDSHQRIRAQNHIIYLP